MEYEKWKSFIDYRVVYYRRIVKSNRIEVDDVYMCSEYISTFVTLRAAACVVSQFFNSVSTPRKVASQGLFLHPTTTAKILPI